jgi:hypothetical protein
LKIKQTIATLLAAFLLMGSISISLASENVLKKMGKAIQYTTRKDASNLSIDTHRAMGHNSVEERHNGWHKHKSIITPGGHIKRIHH